MALKATISRFLSLPKCNASSIPPLPCLRIPFSAAKPSLLRTFCDPSDPPPPPPKQRNPKLVNFSLPSDSDSDSESQPQTAKEVDKSKLPPPYNPFDKRPAAAEDSPEDPKNLQEVFAKIREDGLMSSAAKMFDGLSQDGLTHEALELFSQIKDRGQMPDVVAHTAVMEAYANAGQAKEAHKVHLRMLASGVLPNAYTYRVIIRCLAESGDAGMANQAAKYVGEMVGRGIRPNAAALVAALEGLVEAGMEEEGRGMVKMVREKGAAPEESKAKEALKGKRGAVYRTVMAVLYGK
ncbi:pentatricopeptide repeat-containing protein At4g38150-like [Andrographis paniculata]|uniref:pentatricopeptide repeat-containing protein At4g38150-like n=1 Tax=Andrographis paniculata TaxID=175694 RepID=UPI0021E8DC64|nr:pentatricopeptide repeat-containing protein At4g38150-like [Andrographis paniculata]